MLKLVDYQALHGEEDDEEKKARKHGRGFVTDITGLLQAVLPQPGAYYAGKKRARCIASVRETSRQTEEPYRLLCSTMACSQLKFAGSPNFRSTVFLAHLLRRALVDNDATVPKDELPAINEERASVFAFDCAFIL